MPPLMIKLIVLEMKKNGADYKKVKKDSWKANPWIQMCQYIHVR